MDIHKQRKQKKRLHTEEKDLKEGDEYLSGMKQVFETVRYAKDKEKLKEIMEENHEAFSKIDSDTKDMLEG